MSGLLIGQVHTERHRCRGVIHRLASQQPEEAQRCLFSDIEPAGNSLDAQRGSRGTSDGHSGRIALSDLGIESVLWQRVIGVNLRRTLLNTVAGERAAGAQPSIRRCLGALS